MHHGLWLSYSNKNPISDETEKKNDTRTSDKKPQVWEFFSNITHLGVSKVHEGWKRRTSEVHKAVMSLIWSIMCADWQAGEHVHWTPLCGFRVTGSPVSLMEAVPEGISHCLFPQTPPAFSEKGGWMEMLALYTPASCCYHSHLPILCRFMLSELLSPSQSNQSGSSTQNQAI